MRRLIDIEQKGYGSIGCYTYYVAFGYDIDLGFSWWNFENAVYQEWEGPLTCNKRAVSRKDVRLTLWLQTLTSPMTFTLDFQGKILKLLYLRNGRVDSLGMKGMWVGYDVGCTMGLTVGYGAWQIDRPSNGSVWNPTCWPMNGLFVNWSRGWRVLFSERLVAYSVFLMFLYVVIFGMILPHYIANHRSI